MKSARLLLCLLSGSVLSSMPAFAAETQPASKTQTAVPAPSSHARLQTPKAETITVRSRNGSGTAADYLNKDVALGPLGTRSVLDTPMSIMVVPHDVLVNQQSRNINDLVAYVPSAQLEMRGDPNTSRPQSRGFEGDVIANTRMDGLNMVITTPYAAEQFDSLQVLNGLAGALYGPQNPAGTFDFTLKRPTDRMTERFVVGTDSIGSPLESADVSGRVGKNKWFGYRLNLLNQNGEGYVEGSHLRRDLVSGDFDIHLSDKTVIQIDASQYTYAERGYPGGFAYSTAIQLPQAPDLSQKGYGQPQAGYNMETDTALAKIIHNFNDNWSLKLGGLWQNAARNVFSTSNQLLNSSGLYRQTISAALTANDFVAGSNMAYLNGKFRTGPLRHQIELGTNGYMMGNYNPTSSTGTITLGEATIGHPKSFSSVQPYYSGRYKSADTMNQSLLAGDTISLGKHWSIMGSLAWSWLSTNNYAKSGSKTSSYDRAAAFSPMTSLMYKPTDSQTLYFTWGRSLQAGTTAPVGSVNVNDVTAPLRSEEYEVGYKILIAKRMQVNIAGFRMSRPFGFTDPVTHVYANYGTQRNYGVEFQASGNITDNLTFLGGMTWLDAQMLGTGSSLTANKQVVGVPPLMANALLDYRLPFLKGAAVNANVHYMGRRAANVYNTTFAPSYVTLDLGARYATHAYGQPLVFRFGVNNVTNQSYWASVYPSSINGVSNATNSAVAGLPRTYHFSIELDL
ncbi:TonB-dependent receptor [Gluconobacter kondonii]|uniref:Ligand-gated channel n=1 Tax=Gluconobacter kondonii TaxID=941463 RepID=A0ABQ5WP35_9PROT|nr:TonB-dependent receptor [Gluconobacter kondonii]MCP1235331.1 TonB-dependent receptor [Gluconobacter kondonii]GBR29322.1 TonB-dependent ferric iron siderophore receptor [Gluconobacter kondonii NBRC 3266]GLQ64477.1 ligand-gated channel [Gluconobacter kondonii]